MKKQNKNKQTKFKFLENPKTLILLFKSSTKYKRFHWSGNNYSKDFARREATFRVKNHLAITWFRSEWVKHHVVQPQCDKICVRFITFDLLDSETEIGSLIPISLLKN